MFGSIMIQLTAGETCMVWHFQASSPNKKMEEKEQKSLVGLAPPYCLRTGRLIFMFSWWRVQQGRGVGFLESCVNLRILPPLHTHQSISQPSGLQTSEGSQWNTPCTNLLCMPSYPGAGRGECRQPAQPELASSSYPVNWSRLYGKAASWRNDCDLFTRWWTACPAASRSCSVDALPAAARLCRGSGRSEGSAGGSAGMDATAGSTAAGCASGWHPARCKGAATPLLHLPLSRAASHSGASPFIHCLQLSRREAGVISPSVLLLVFYPFFFFLLMNQSLGENNRFI